MVVEVEALHYIILIPASLVKARSVSITISRFPIVDKPRSFLCGGSTVGYRAALLFIRHIYRSIKYE
ncbi:hypothetical protein HPP92_005456 [Vanilla planifolia]|uniref:Uncharacterized protein n=1 Tax=Vanilla planifolia TaxID=51239 RepID=A0A835RQ64_VANPL|nr:hypothetical protein HPP92_005773 [Vanilla planifolia]KAG0494462.1 hypothetical protein HPP92_005456 [Vanilla planifolia]